MFTVLGTWEVIGEVQGERYTAINIHSSRWWWGGGGVRSSVQEKWKQRMAEADYPLESDRKSPAA